MVRIFFFFIVCAFLSRALSRQRTGFLLRTAGVGARPWTEVVESAPERKIHWPSVENVRFDGYWTGGFHRRDGPFLKGSDAGFGDVMGSGRRRVPALGGACGALTDACPARPVRISQVLGCLVRAGLSGRTAAVAQDACSAAPVHLRPFSHPPDPTDREAPPS